VVDTVLLTGASSGLGLALSKLLCSKASHRLVLTARESSLPRFAAAGIVESENVWLRPLDVLINNAGISYRSVVEHVDEEERLKQMNVNFLSPMHLMRLVLPEMRRKRRGKIINVSSVGGMMAMPTMSIYSASKFALEGVSESLWYEVRPWNIKVVLMEPGFIDSPSFHNTRYTLDSQNSMDRERDPYHAHYEKMAPFIERTMRRATPEKTAKRIYDVIRRRNPPLRVPATTDAHMFSLLRRLLPRSLYHWEGMLPDVRSWGPTLDVFDTP
jgi:short-subunit dehydrogenase